MLNILNRIVAEQGEGILADAKRLFPFFADYAKNEYKEERVAFGRCIEYGAYNELKNTRTADERQRLKATLAVQINAKTGVDRPRCADALDLLEMVIFKTVQQSTPAPSQAKFCTKCGKELQAGWTSCPYCSTPVVNNVCSKCGKELQEGWTSCPYCSTPKASVAPQNNPAPTQVQRQSANDAAKPTASFRAEPISFFTALGGLLKKYIVTIEGHEIKALYYSTNLLELFVDENLIAQKGKIWNTSEKGETPRVSVKYPFQSGEATIEVYIKFGALLDQLKICINGIFVGGDPF